MTNFSIEQFFKNTLLTKHCMTSTEVCTSVCRQTGVRCNDYSFVVQQQMCISLCCPTDIPCNICSLYFQHIERFPLQYVFLYAIQPTSIAIVVGWHKEVHKIFIAIFVPLLLITAMITPSLYNNKYVFLYAVQQTSIPTNIHCNMCPLYLQHIVRFPLQHVFLYAIQPMFIATIVGWHKEIHKIFIMPFNQYSLQYLLDGKKKYIRCSFIKKYIQL